MAFLPAFLFSHRSYPVDKGHINDLVSPQQILLVVYTHYIAIPVDQACQCLIEGQSGQDTYFRQYRSATRTASIVASSQLGANHPSCLISSCLARASSCDNGWISTPPATAVADQFFWEGGGGEGDYGPREGMKMGKRGQGWWEGGTAVRGGTG